MAVLTIIRDGKSQEFNFTPPLLLDAALEQAGFSIPRPCGGRGVCGKCAVMLEGTVSDPNEAERKAGTRLSCQAQLLGDARVTLADVSRDALAVAKKNITRHKLSARVSCVQADALQPASSFLGKSPASAVFSKGRALSVADTPAVISISTFSTGVFCIRNLIFGVARLMVSV